MSPTTIPGNLLLKNGMVITGTQRYQPAALLDQFPGAAAAYSLRNLVGTSNPAVVRVRRDNDDAEADFTATQVSDGTLAAWVGAGNNGFVRTWYDQSGNGIDAANTNSNTTQPKVVTNGTLELDSNTSKPAVLFSGAQYLDFSRQANIEQLFSVARNNASAVTTVSRDATTTDLRGFFLRLNPNGWNMQQIGPFPVTGQNLLQQNQTYSLGILANGTNAVYYTNGAASSTFAETDKISANQLGRYHLTVYNLVGNISEYILYSSDQSANRAAIEANINAHYNIF